MTSPAADPDALRSEEASLARSRRARRVFAWTLLGALLTQAAWILVVPAFRASDEHEHAYKAAAVAAGDWSSTHEVAPRKWGELMVVPKDIVTAAGPECRRLPYTTVDNCGPGQDVGNGQVRIASSASRYNPVYYAVVGIASEPLTGAARLYAMRAVGALLCALLLAAGAAALSLTARTRWPAVGTVLAITPIVTFSTAMVAPNGIEMAAGVLVWSALLGLTRLDPAGPTARRLVVMATVGAVPLVTVRSLGPLWLACILVCIALMTPRATLWAWSRLRVVRAATVVVGAATAAGVLWTMTAGTNSLGAGSGGEAADAARDIPSLAATLPKSSVVWVLQSIAAFPYRDMPAPGPVYVIAVLLGGVVAYRALRLAARSDRRGLIAIAVLGGGVPLAMTAMTYYAAGGVIWQGRYALPLTVGFFLAAGTALDRGTGSGRVPLVVATVAVVVEQALSLSHVLSEELATSPSAHTSAWPAPPLWVVLALCVAGAAACLRGYQGTAPAAPAAPSPAPPVRAAAPTPALEPA